jgi:hypothetical protein
MASAFTGKNNFSTKSIGKSTTMKSTQTSAFAEKNNFSTKSIGKSRTMKSTQTSEFTGKNHFSTKSIGKRKMSKSAQLKEEQRAKIREQFLRDLFTEDNSEHGFSIFEKPKTKRYRSEVKIQMSKPKVTKVVEKKPELKKRETVAQRFLKQGGQTVADRFKAQKVVRPVIPADSVVTKVGPGRYNIAVDLNKKRPTRKAPDVLEGVALWRPTPKPRTVLPKQKPVPKPRTVLPKDRPVPLPRKTKPTKIHKPVKQLKEVKEQPQVITPELHEIDPFGTDLQKPGHKKIETAANGAAVTYMITPQYMDPLEQMTASRQVVRSILVKELGRMGGLK